MEQPGTNWESKKDKVVKETTSAARWSGLAFQMLAAIIAGVWGGMWLDKKMDFTFPAFTLGLSLLAVIGSIYLVYREAVKE